jgi:uncharacterized protein (TIGR02680 family)
MGEPFELEPLQGRLLNLPPEAVPPRPVELPSPGRERFQPLRAGILNVWQYDEQEFRFHEGRLILRGENGTGKSKALEVLLPFLLDADLSPQRLDPFGGSARTMEWNLLQDGRYESRVGYVWLELGRREETEPPGEPRDVFWTLGCGLRASQRTRRVDPWYFLTRLRIGAGFAVLSPNGTPLLKEQLRQEIGDEGWVFDTGRDYREKLDAQIFGLGEDRFSTLRHLLLQLRRPHLSEKLDPRTLSDLLKESLPPLDPNLIGQLSEGFERLDNDQKELARAEAATVGVAAFLDLYREYGRGMARGRAAEVRQSDSRYHKTAGELREAEAERERLEALLGDLTGRERRTELEIESSHGTIRALEQSPEMRSAETLRIQREHAESLARRADQDREDEAREARTAEDRRRDLERADGEARRAESAREGSALAAEAAAREAGLEAVFPAALAALPERAEAAAATVRAALHQREEGVSELRRLASERDNARRQEERTQERFREADAQVRAAVERSREARAEVERQRESLEEALLSWWSGLTELRLDEEAFEALRAGIVDEGRGSNASDLARSQRDALVRERTALEAEKTGVAEARRETEKERQRVAAARELGPEPPRTRASDRTERAGAPLYLLCEFSENLREEDRAGLESALEAAGLLDAWITPEGAGLPPGTLDTFLVPASSGPEGPTLADLLVPSPGHGVDPDVLSAVLRSIQVAGGAHSVGTDGTFRLGPLGGAWSKPTAEHVGAGAREAARQRRLAELAARIAALDLQLSALTAQAEALDERLERLSREVAGAPSPAELRRARHQEEAAAGDEHRRRMELDAAAAEASAARTLREAAERRLEARARELGLAAHLEDLEGYRDRLRSFSAAFRELVRAAEAARAAEDRAERARGLFDQAMAREADARRRARESLAVAEAARAEHAALEATVGAGAREVVERHQAATRLLQELKARRSALTEEVQTVREERARAQERLANRQADLEERDADRARAAERLRRFTEAGFLPLVFESPAEEPAAAWSLTRALEIAREIEKASAGVNPSQEAANRRANRLHERFHTLASDLGAEYQPSLDQDEDLSIVRVRHDGRDHDVPGLLAALRENVEVRRALLADHERELLRRFLLGEVGDHLRGRLLQARDHVEHMNELLVGCQTASGMALKLSWEPAPEAAPEIREAVRLLRQDLALLSDGDRRRLEAFFQSRISEARQQWEAVPWREHLLAALDYRAWYRFRILRRTGDRGDWTELTRRGHDASSGGEKAVALHLPLFAAAAAHYRTAHGTAPRLILLDEAFAGIDQGMRGRCMGLLVAFDLDFLMTSHDEWGCYEELPGVATYQLFRESGLEGVAAVRFVWNGRGLREEHEPRGAG